MRRLLLSILLITASIVTIGAANLTSNDPYWIGADPTFGTTEGNDFWLTFMNNAMFDPSSPLNANITFELKVAISARQQTSVFVEVGSTVIPVDVSPNTTEIVDLSDLYATIYLLNSEVTNQYKGIHVYTLEPNKSFSCFNYSRNGEAGESSRDATLIIPTKFMGKEYFVQTYYEDNFSSEFAIVATDSNTVVHIWPAYATAGGSAANSEIVVPLNEPGDAYLLASAPHQGNFIKVDLSGSKICSNKPIAVFNGNQQTSIPYHEANSKDYLSEQILPLSQWGTDFYLAQMGGTKKNYFIITAAYPNTEVVINSYITSDNDTVSETINLVNAGDTYTPYDLSNEYPEVTIHSDKPIMCYVYSTSAGSNEYCTGSGRNKICYYYGDPANALMPSWAHRTTSMNFFTHQLDPFVEEDKPEPPQKFYVFLVAKWDDRNAITVDGATHAADFHQFRGDQTMAYASIEIMDGPNPADKYHVVESTGDGFVGVVYGLTDAQGYLYTLGYTPDPFRDSLFVENPENIMVAGYDLPRIEQGWYQRQWDEWAKGHERLDTAQVCDSTVVQWMVQTPITKGKTPVEWKIYDVTNGAKPGEATLIEGYPTEQATPTRTTETDWIYQFEHQFVLPDESALPPEQRIPFKEYEIHAVLHQAHQICPDIPAETDTLKTTVRVTRVYHDTIYQYICMGDSYEFFNDSLPNQGDLSQKADTKSPTTFIGDKTDGESTTDFEWKARLGENIFDRAYQTIYGCDSTYTLFLFVCDTFRRVDTVHLCDNQSVEYETEKFKGILAPDIDGTIVTKDSVAIIYDKTRYCPCQENPKYPAFQGCDSIFELHIMLHKTYRDTLVDTMCYNDKPDSLYRWPIQYSARDSLIGKNHPNMVYYDNLQAWVGFFSDTLQTQTCPECNEGKGCDSINILKLIIPKSYYDEQQDSICQWDYDKTTRTKITNVYRWYHHRNGADYVELPESGVYYDSCLTRYGCDSVYTLELKYLEPFLQVDKHVMATNQTYKWHGVTYGPYLEEEFKNLADGDTTLYFHNDNENQVHPVNGCDSIYRLELTLMDTYLFKTYRTICDNDSVHWRDTVIVGSEWEGSDPYDIRLTKTYTTVFDSLKTVELPERDSVYQLTVTMWPNYAQYDTLYVCDNDSVEWEGQWYKGADGALDDERHYPTKHDCDSAFYLHLLVKPSYHFAVEDSAVCQNEPFVWTQHTQITIPTDVAGEFYYYDSCLTTTCPLCEGGGCDSIYTLRLTVHPVYDIYEEYTICSSDSLHWQGMLFTGNEFANYGGTYDAAAFRRVTTNLPAGEHTDTAWYHTTGYECDSIYHLTLTVLPVYRTEIERRACQDELTYHYEYLNNGLGGDLPAAHLSDSLTRNDTIQALNGCDSIITLHFYVDSVYKYTQDAGFVCQEIGGTWEWRNSFGDLLGTVSLDKGDSLVLLGERYTTVHGCDSAFGVELYIAPIHDIYEERTICANDSLHWQGMLFTGDEFANYGGTYDATAFRRVTTNLPAGEHTDTAWYHTMGYGCDSIYHLTLTVLPVYRTEIERRACQDELTYHYEYLNNGLGGDLPAAHLSDSLTRNDTIQALNGCDSIITLHFYVDSVYKYTQDAGFVCQEIGGTWEWRNSFGDLLGTVSLDKGDSLVVLGERYTTVHGCDSAFGVELYIAPIHDIYEERTICANDSLHWQGMLFTGDEFANYGGTYDATAFRRVTTNLPAGEHTDTAWYHTTGYGCDSIRHLTLTVLPVGRETIERRACQSEGTYYYEHMNNGAGGYLPAAHLSDSLKRIDTIQTALGCDSIVTLHYYVDSVYNYTSRQVICQEYGTDWIWYENGVPQDTISLDKGDTTYILGRIYTTIHGCDSMYGKSLYVAPIYHIYDTATLCSNDSLHWQGMLFTGNEYDNYGKTYIDSDFDSVKLNLSASEYDYAIRRGTSAYDCDSVHHLHLTVNAVGRETIERRACQSEGTYYYEHLNNGAGGYLPAAHLSDALTRNDTIQTALGCDSIVTLHYYVDSVYNYTSRQVICQEYGTDWIWYENGVPQDTISLDKGDTTYVLGRSYTTIHGCDSTYGKSVYVAPIYHFYDTLNLCENDSLHWQGMLFTGSQYTAYGKSYDASAFDSVRADVMHGTYQVDINRPTIHSCDSTYHLTLFVHEVARTDSVDSICQGTPFFNPNWNWGQGRYMNTDRVGTYTSVDTIYSAVTGCDSIVTLTLRVDSVYDYNIRYTFCQDTIDTMREWIDEEGKSHGWVLDISQPGDFRIDRLFTTIHGCDSTYGVAWHVDPIYRFDTIIDMCENSRIEWQNTRFTGDSVHDITAEDSVIRTPGTYYEFRHYETVAGCDSDYYATIHVHAVYDTLTLVEICESEGFIWYQNDYSGLGPFADTVCHVSHGDTVRLLPSEAVFPQQARDITVRSFERMLVTSSGCDSLSRLRVTVKPTYFFLTDTTICASERVLYRGKYFSYKDTVYTDSLMSSLGCDSIYQFKLHVRPIFLHTRRVTICDNDTLFHTSLNGQEIVWKPGDEVRNPEWEYYDMVYTDHNGCDSIYRYYITVYPSYLFLDTTVMCSQDSFMLNSNHYVGEKMTYPTETYVAPYQMYYGDTLQTIHGCDSIYGLYATIYPSYHHCDTITICDDSEADWRTHHYEGSMLGNVPGDGLMPGRYVFYDSLLTEHDCDSVYELQLIVTATYLSVDSITKCADDDLTWRSFNLDHVAAGEHFIYDSLFSGHGCDSVYHLYLTVLDTTREDNYDTICYNDTLFVLGHQYRTAGDYKDTATNEMGCHHFIYTHLSVIDPTVPTAWVDSMCKNEDAFDLYYTYTGFDPVTFSLYFDDLGHEMGFEDMIDMPVTEYTDPMVITIPTPLRDGDKKNYPRPDIYGVHLILDNGLCRHPELDCYDDTTFVMSYPSWLTEQRFGDVIALFNEKYNGGYYWDHYQWFHGDELLIGETHEYLYIPTGLIVGDQYHVRLTREGETEDFQTCPITIVGDPINNDFSPQMGYLSVVPTCIVIGHPYANILSRKDGMYRISSSTGHLVSEGVFRADVTQVELPAIAGMYIFQLWSADTPEEPYRSIKVIVKDVCESCNSPF